MNQKWIPIFLLGLLMLGGCFSPIAPPAPVLDISEPKAEICMTKEGYAQLEKQLYDKGYAAGFKASTTCAFDFKLNHPTYAQLQKFLSENDAVRKCQGNCLDRVVMLSNAAIKVGWEMYAVILNSNDAERSHSIVAFDTKDRGLIYIEPQTFWEVKVEIGYNYALEYRKNGWTAQDFIITQIGIIK